MITLNNNNNRGVIHQSTESVILKNPRFLVCCGVFVERGNQSFHPYFMILLLSRQVERTLLQQSMAIVHLDNITVGAQFPALSHLDVLLARVLGESPLETLENLLSSRKLELSPPDGLDDVRFAGVFSPHGQQHLSDGNPGGHADGLAVGVSHSRGEPIGAGARQHLVGPNDVEGMDADANVVSVFSHGVGQVLVDGDATRLEGLARNLLLLVAHQVGHEGEEIHRRLLGAHVVDLDFGFGHAAAVAGLDVGFVLLVAVATEGTATHGVGKSR